MLDTLGPEIQVHNSTGGPIELKAGNHVTITPDLSKAPSSEVLPIKFGGLAKVSEQYGKMKMRIMILLLILVILQHLSYDFLSKGLF